MKYRCYRWEYSNDLNDPYEYEHTVWEGDTKSSYKGGQGCFDEHPIIINRLLEKYDSDAGLYFRPK